MNDILEHREDIKKNILKSFKTDLEKSENSSDIEKARSGVYADTFENRKLNRVGQEYGSKKEQEENSGSKNSKSIEEHAKNTDDETLKKVIANKNAPENIRNEARNEFTRRQGSEKKNTGSDEKWDDVLEKIVNLEDEYFENDDASVQDIGEKIQKIISENKMSKKDFLRIYVKHGSEFTDGGGITSDDLKNTALNSIDTFNLKFYK